MLKDQMINESMILLELMKKKTPFTFEEKELISRHIDRNKIEILYCINNNPLSKKRTFLLVFDFMPNGARGNTLRRNMHTICRREMSEIEFEDLINNYGACGGRRFMKWQYNSLQKLIDDDKNCGIETPKEVIECAKINNDIISL